MTPDDSPFVPWMCAPVPRTAVHEQPRPPAHFERSEKRVHVSVISSIESPQ